MKLREYQTAAVDAAFASMRRGMSPCVVLPTGAGKSLVIAESARRAIEDFNGRVMVIAHRKELLVQNADKICKLLPNHEVGIWSAGLGKKQGWQDIVCAGIQSCFRNADVFGMRHLLIFDECHLIPKNDSTMYRKFISDMRIAFPRAKLLGLTATPFRLDSGVITDIEIFDEICYEASVSDLMRQGYLSHVTNQPTHEVDLSRVKVVRGEFAQQQLEETFLAEVDANVAEALALSAGRQSVLWFSSGVHHARTIAETLERLGEDVGLVTGETLSLERVAILERFATRKLRHVVNCDVLTTGFDAPCIDAIVVLRGTESAGLFAQICGRGFRLFDGKSDCLILDYGGNIDRHGPLDDPMYGRRKKRKRAAAEKSETSTVLTPQKDCPACGESVSARAVWCGKCGAEFPVDSILDESADTQSQLLSDGKPAEPRWFTVESLCVSRHQPRDPRKIDTLRIDYSLEDGDLVALREWICIEHEGYARQKAEQWWAKHSIAPCPESIDDAIELSKLGALRKPRRIKAIEEGPRWWKVLEHEFDDERPETWASEYDEWAETDEEIPF